MTSIVLDASAVLALINSEPGAEAVTAVLDDAMLSVINYSEVISKLLERGAPLDQAKAAVKRIGLEISGFDLNLAEQTAVLRAQTKSLGLSFADRACLSLAEREGVPALTGDRTWQQLKSNIKIQLFR